MFGACEREWSVTITVHDRGDVLRHPDGRWLLPWYRYVHRHTFCTTGRLRDTASDRCLAHCHVAVNQLAAVRPEGFVHSCWKGGSEVVVPIHRGGRHVLTLFGGVWRGTGEATDPQLAAPLRDLARALPELRDAVGIRSGLQLLGVALLAWGDDRRMQVTEDDHRRRAIRTWIEARLANQEDGLEALAAHLSLSPSRTSHVVHDLFGQSFTELLITQRISQAQRLLATTSLPAAQIAERCGFSSPMHFSRLFRQRCGVPPGRWREGGIGGQG
jgi:AraC-like DNA-binding protein